MNNVVLHFLVLPLYFALLLWTIPFLLLNRLYRYVVKPHQLYTIHNDLQILFGHVHRFAATILDRIP